MRGVVKGGLNDGGSNIKSIQHGVHTMASATDTVTIDSVNINNAIVRIIYGSGGNGTPDYICAKARIVNSTSIELSTTNPGATITWEVIEFNNVKSIQQGDITISSNSNANVTISDINTTKALLFYSFKSNITAASAYAMELKGIFFDATTIQFQGYAPTYTTHWQVIEFN